MQELFAHVKGERHDFMFTKFHRRRWSGFCTCKRMLDKTGTQQAIANAWKEHIRLEGERQEAEVYITEIP